MLCPGVLRWRFLSLDPVTRELIDDPLDGFLLPNVVSLQGEGFVSYSITPKPNLQHGTQFMSLSSRRNRFQRLRLKTLNPHCLLPWCPGLVVVRTFC